MTLQEAINGVETTQVTLTNDQTAQVTAKAKADAANAALDATNTAVGTDVTNFNAALDALIQAASDAKIPPPGTPIVQVPPVTT